jgi:hypothetical protein
MNATPSLTTRRAALVAHAMPEGDRAWLLDELQPTHRVVLSGLLKELQLLGVPRDASLLEDFTRPPLVRQPSTPLGELQSLGTGEVAGLAELMEFEPPLLVSRLLAAGDWPWRQQLLDALSAGRRDAVLGFQSLARAPRLEQALCEHTARCLRQRRQTAGFAPVLAGGRWTQILRAWRRG